MTLLRLWRAWSTAVGPQVAQHACPIRQSGKTLIVRVAHAPWLHELSFLKTQIVAKLAQTLPDAKIQDIRLEQGELPKGLPTPRSPALKVQDDVQLTPQQEEFVDMALHPITDASVREAARKAMRRGFFHKAKT